MSTIEITSLIWNDRNRAHIKRHNVNDFEVEEVCHDEKCVIYETYNNRILLTGRVKNNRYITVILSQGDFLGVYYVVTARDANKKERRAYDKENT